MDDTQLLRYARHLLLPEIGVEGQRRLLAAHALVVGAGGLGSAALLYLASAGVGRVTVVDHDDVDLTNLQRQIAHDTTRLGQPKAESARQSMRALNPDVEVTALVRRADPALLDTLVPAADVVLDCTDGFAIRQAINAACVRHRRPLVAGAAIGFDGQVGVYDRRRDDGACWACVFPPGEAFDDAACATMGVFAPLVGMVGATMAAEALKLLAGAGTPAVNRLLMLDARRLHWDTIAVCRRAGCAVCG